MLTSFWWDGSATLPVQLLVKVGNGTKMRTLNTILFLLDKCGTY